MDVTELVYRDFYTLVGGHRIKKKGVGGTVLSFIPDKRLISKEVTQHSDFLPEGGCPTMMSVGFEFPGNVLYHLWYMVEGVVKKLVIPQKLRSLFEGPLRPWSGKH